MSETTVVCVTRYDSDGRKFHTCNSRVHEVYTNENGHICIDMPMRFWIVTEGGALELSAL